MAKEIALVVVVTGWSSVEISLVHFFGTFMAAVGEATIVVVTVYS